MRRDTQTASLFTNAEPDVGPAQLKAMFAQPSGDLTSRRPRCCRTATRHRLSTGGIERRYATDDQKQFSAYLEEADVILCLASPDFISSEYCYSREMTRVLERDATGEAKVIPVIVRHCDWPNTPLANLRGTPRDNRPVKSWPDRDEAWLDVARDVRAALLAADGGVRSSKDNLAAVVMPASYVAPVVARPRSANVAVERRFTDLDRDRFVRQTFEFFTEFFANSVAEVQARAPDVEGSIVNVDANRFTAAAYRDGRKRPHFHLGLRRDQPPFARTQRYRVEPRGVPRQHHWHRFEVVS